MGLPRADVHGVKICQELGWRVIGVLRKRALFPSAKMFALSWGQA